MTELREPIAVVGVSALMPGSSDAEGYWRDILEGRDRITDVPESHWLISDYYDPDPRKQDKTYARRGAFLSPIDFDPVEFGVPPSIVPATDTSQLLSLVAAKRLLDDVAAGNVHGIDASKIDRSRMSVILGATSAQELVNQMASRLQRPIWVKALREQGLPEEEVDQICDRISKEYTPWQESTFPGLLGNVIAGRIANRLDLGGTNCVTDAACASSFSALSMAVSELRMGDSDIAICGGVETLNDIFMFMCFSKTPALSMSGDIRPFSDKADGTMLGEGIALVALKRLSDAERDGDRVYAVIKAIGTSSDGRAKSVYAPVPEGQAKALRRAYVNAGYGPETVELVEAHGTGTKAGDAAEVEALKTVFGEADRSQHDKQWCALGTVKSQVGHTKACAGAAGLLKAIFALQHKVLPPTIKIDAPNEAMEIDESAFYLSTVARPWVRGSDHPRRASVSSFGFGGSNFHIALEEYAGEGRVSKRLRTLPSELVLVSGDDGASIAAQCRSMSQACDRVGMLAFFAYDTQRTANAGKRARLSIVATDDGDLQRKLVDAATRIESSPNGAFSLPGGVDYAASAEAGKVALLFPGQGSQYVGMGGDLAMAFDEALSVWDRVADRDVNGGKLHDVVFPRPVFSDEARAAQTERLTQTDQAQPAIGVTSASMLALLAAIDLRFDATGGHSFGEVTALFAGGVLDVDSFVHVSAARGAAMAKAASTTSGAMAAIPKTLDEVKAILAALPEAMRAAIVIANHNGPKQVVVSGEASAIDGLVATLQGQGVPAKKLPVATAFHSPIVAGATVDLRAAIDGVGFEPSRVPVFGNTDAAPYAPDAQAMRTTLAGQLARPVRFVDQLKAMHDAGVRTFIEVGPGSVLTQLTLDTLGEGARAISLDRKGKNGVTSLWTALGRLFVAGATFDVARLWESFRTPVDPRTKKKPAMVIGLTGTNHGKPYPPKGGTAALPKPNPPRRKPAPEIVVPQLAAQASAPKEVIKEVIKEVVREVPVAATSATPRTPMASAHVANPGWADAYQEVQRQTADAHMSYLKALADSHGSFLKVAEASIAALTGAPMTSVTHVADAAPRYETASPRRSAPVHNEPIRVEAAAPHVVAAPVHHAEPAPIVVPATPAVAHVAPAPAQTASKPVAVALEPILLAVVADKTGYPVDMLTMEMALEADLGIDSIKRVEILSAFKERVPNLPTVKASDMAALRTLGEIVAFMQKNGAVSAPATNGVAPHAPTSSGTVAHAAPSVALEPILLAVVADKTGYPVDMLTMEMALEADLGIDSIKRVEILSAFKERVPNLPTVKASDMAALRTLGEIVAFMQKNGAVSAPATNGVAPHAPTSSGTVAHAAPSVALEPILLAVVADKTGYPVEMLTMEMALEADLGIDSIKRVEILSAFKERVPNLPTVKASDMAALRTLGEIVAFMQKNGAVSAPATSMVPSTMRSETAPTASGTIAANPALGRFALRQVAAPAGGLGTLPRGLAIAVTDDGRGVATALVQRLGMRGVDARVVTKIEPGTRGVVHLGGLRALTNVDEAIAVNGEAFDAACVVGKSLATDATASGLFVTVQATGGDFGLSGIDALRAWSAGLSGLAKTAAQEWSAPGRDVRVKAIDLELGGRNAEALAETLAREIVDGGKEREVGLHADGRRTTLESYRSPAASATGELPNVNAKSVIVASGGARGVTAATLIALAKKFAPKIVLLGRTPILDEPASCRGEHDEAAIVRALLAEGRARGENKGPAELRALAKQILSTREVKETIAAIEGAGAQAMYVAADVKDGAAIGRALDAARARFGAITGVVHGAGVLADKLLSDKTRAHFDAVFDTKVAGLRALLQATERDPLSFIVLFSSVAARCGNVGQSDYAMANEVLNKVAAVEARRRNGEQTVRCVVRALGWGPWESGMVTPALKARFAELGVPLIPLDVGAQMLVDELATRRAGDQTEAEVVLGGEPRMEALASSPSGSAAGETRVPIVVDAGRYPALESHRIHGAIVLPAVFAVEWLTHAASQRLGTERLVVRDVKVLKGIKLGADDAGITLTAIARDAGEGRVSLELRNESGVLHYTANADRTLVAPSMSNATPTTTAAPWTARDTYHRRILFHGPDFQAIRSIDALDQHGAVATIATSSALGWAASHPIGRWQTDPALLDGALQIARLWGVHMTGAPSLPTTLGTVVQHRAIVAGSELRCVLIPRKHDEYRTVTDVGFFDAAGNTVVEMLGIEMHFISDDRPSEAPRGNVEGTFAQAE